MPLWTADNVLFTIQQNPRLKIACLLLVLNFSLILRTLLLAVVFVGTLVYFKVFERGKRILYGSESNINELFECAVTKIDTPSLSDHLLKLITYCL